MYLQELASLGNDKKSDKEKVSWLKTILKDKEIDLLKLKIKNLKKVF